MSIRGLIELHREFAGAFKDPSAKNLVIWQEITDRLMEKFPGFVVTRSKVKNLFTYVCIFNRMYKSQQFYIV